MTHLDGLGFAVVSSHVDGADAGSLAFAHRFGFEEVDRQVEQVQVVGHEARPAPPDGVELVSVADCPGLLAEAYDLAVEGYADMATSTPVTVALEDWLVEKATLPGGSFDARRRGGGRLLRSLPSARPGGRGGRPHRNPTELAAARTRGGLKRAELAWAAQNGIREVVTWTQRGNEGMRALNEQLGYVPRRERRRQRADRGDRALTAIGTGVLDCGAAGRRPRRIATATAWGAFRAPSFAVRLR